MLAARTYDRRVGPDNALLSSKDFPKSINLRNQPTRMIKLPARYCRVFQKMNYGVR